MPLMLIAARHSCLRNSGQFLRNGLQPVELYRITQTEMNKLDELMEQYGEP